MADENPIADIVADPTKTLRERVSLWMKTNGLVASLIVMLLSCILAWQMVKVAIVVDERYAKEVELRREVDGLDKRLSELNRATNDFASIYLKQQHKNAPLLNEQPASSVVDTSTLSEAQRNAIMSSMPPDVRIIAIVNKK